MTVTPIPLDHLTPDPAQPRLDLSAADLAALVESVRTRGQLLPLRVRPADAAGHHVILSGHRRHEALLAAGASHADCVVVDGLNDEVAVLAEQLAENVIRQNLSPVEEAAAYRRYLALSGVPPAQAARDLHVPPARLSRLLPLLDLPAAVRGRVHRGELAADAGYHLARLPDGGERDRLLARAATGTVTRDEAARAATRTQAPVADAASPPAGRVTCRLPGGRSLTLTAGAVGLDALIAALEEVLKEARAARRQGLDVHTLTRVLRDRAANGGAA